MLLTLALAAALTGSVPDAIEKAVRERMGEVRVEVVELVGSRGSKGSNGAEGSDEGSAGAEGSIGSPSTRSAGTSRKPRAESREPAAEGRKLIVTGPEPRAHSPEPAAEGREPKAESPEPALIALPEPGSRLGRPIRFILVADGARVGSVVAKLAVTGSVVRARHALSRGDALDADAVETADTTLEHMLLRRLPAAVDLVGAEARRDIAGGEVLTDSIVAVPPTVRSGDEVTVSVVSGPIEVTGVGRASGSGRPGDLIRVLIPSSRTPLKARITGPGSVEIVR